MRYSLTMFFVDLWLRLRCRLRGEHFGRVRIQWRLARISPKMHKAALEKAQLRTDTVRSLTLRG